MGPFAPAELKSQPQFSDDSLVCPEDKSYSQRRNWKPARKLKSLAAALEAASSPAAPAPPPSPPEAPAPAEVPAPVSLPAQEPSAAPRASAAVEVFGPHERKTLPSDATRFITPVPAPAAKPSAGAEKEPPQAAPAERRRTLDYPTALLVAALVVFGGGAWLVMSGHFSVAPESRPSGKIGFKPDSVPAPATRRQLPEGIGASAGEPVGPAPAGGESFGVVKASEKRKSDAVSGPASLVWLNGLPDEDVLKLRRTMRKDVWEACFSEKVFASCAAACAKYSGCVSPSGWDICLRLYHDEQYCVARCWEERACEAPGGVLSRLCFADSTKPYCRRK